MSGYPFVPRLSLFGEEVLLEDGAERAIAAVMTLEFDYGGSLVRSGGPLAPEESFRQPEEERKAELLLESLGALEVSCVHDCIFDFDSRATHLVSLDDPEGGRGRAFGSAAAHIGCSFVLSGAPRLREAGFDVRLEPSFPFPVHEKKVRVKAEVALDECRDWFELRLGIVIDGRPHDLVPALIELIEHARVGHNFETLLRCPARYRAIRLDTGRYVAIPWERLVALVRVLSELYPDPGSGCLRLERPRLGELFDVHEALQGSPEVELEWAQGQEIVERARALRTGPTWSPEPAALRAKLRPYQREGLTWLEHLRDLGLGGILADDMGLGKTLQTIALLSREKEARRIDRPCLIVTPTSLTGNWLRELGKFAPHLQVATYTGPKRKRVLEGRMDVLLTSYPLLVRDGELLAAREFHYVILDEAQAIKNPLSLASIAARKLPARHRLLLSGTPVENNLTELWSLFDFVLPGLLGTRRDFQRRFQIPIEHDRDPDRIDQLRNRVKPFVLRRLKESVAPELPPKTELIRAVELGRAQRELYESVRIAADRDVRGALRTRGWEGAQIQILDALMKLRQICCDPRLVELEAARPVSESAKATFFFELTLRELSAGRRILVFSQFAKMLALLARGLHERQVKTLMLTGATKDRMSLIEQFDRGEADVFLISLKAGGTGLNLVSADTVVHYDPWWNAAAQMQATDRAYRIGQTKPVFVYNLIAAGSVEERMLGLQAQKRRLAEDLFGTTGHAPLLTPDSLSELLAPLDEPGAPDSSRL